LAEAMLDNAMLKEIATKMVTPASRREAVAHLRVAFALSERRACLDAVMGPNLLVFANKVVFHQRDSVFLVTIGLGPCVPWLDDVGGDVEVAPLGTGAGHERDIRSRPGANVRPCPRRLHILKIVLSIKLQDLTHK
jgi:hypothetical protein